MAKKRKKQETCPGCFINEHLLHLASNYHSAFPDTELADFFGMLIEHSYMFVYANSPSYRAAEELFQEALENAKKTVLEFEQEKSNES
jgi:hypothetical protein